MVNSEIGRNSNESQATVVRTPSSTALFVIVAGLCAIGVISILIGDFTLRGLATAGIPGSVGILVWAGYRFPHVELRHQELVLVNPLQTAAIPWNLVDGFDTHFGLSVRTQQKSFSSWPLASRGKKTQRDERNIRRFVEARNPAVDQVLDRYAGLGDDELSNPGGRRTIVTVWNVGVIAVCLLAIAWAVIGFSSLPS